MPERVRAMSIGIDLRKALESISNDLPGLRMRPPALASHILWEGIPCLAHEIGVGDASFTFVAGQDYPLFPPIAIDQAGAALQVPWSVAGEAHVLLASFLSPQPAAIAEGVVASENHDTPMEAIRISPDSSALPPLNIEQTQSTNPWQASADPT